MNRLKNIKGKKTLSGYLTVGHPSISITEKVIYEMVESGLDILELGIPFSDPNAEGSIVHNANIKALENNITVKDVFALIKKVREKVTIPITIYSYCNPIFVYGYEEFFKECSEAGVDGVYIPDLPFEEKDEMEKYALKNNIDIVYNIIPISDERIKKLSLGSKELLYLVGLNEIEDLKRITELVKAIKDISLVVQKDINNSADYKGIVNIADGVYIKNNFVEIINEYGDNSPAKIKEFIKNIKN